MSDLQSIIDALKNPDNGVNSMRVSGRGALSMDAKDVYKSQRYKELVEWGNKNLERPKFSKAILDIAKKNIEEFKRQSDESFLIRAELDRKLDGKL